MYVIVPYVIRQIMIKSLTFYIRNILCVKFKQIHHIGSRKKTTSCVIQDLAIQLSTNNIQSKNKILNYADYL